MGKVKIIVAALCLFGSSVCSFATGRDRDIRDNVIDTLTFYLWVKEATGNNDGYQVEKFIASTGLNPKGQYPWCAAFITYSFKANGLEVPQYPARAASWFDSEHEINSKDATQGDLGSLYYRNLGRIGHIFMYLEPYVNSTPFVTTGEGNTNVEGSREGNRAAKRHRPRGVVYSSADWIPKPKVSRFYKCNLK